MKIYDCNGNIIGIYTDDIENMPKDKLKKLVQFFRAKNIDTVMFVKNIDIQNNVVTTKIFEPNAGELGGWSTMCGNGVRALTSYYRDFVKNVDEIIINTDAGFLKVIVKDGKFKVKMGRLYVGINKCTKYLSFKLKNWDFIENLLKIEKIRFTNIEIGFTSTNEKDPDGEPHLCVEIPSVNLVTLKQIALQVGQKITNNFEIFPLGVNVNFYSSSKNVVLLVTHERNLGFDPNKCITQSCGTGSTVVGGLVMYKNNFPKIIVRSQGGDLVISREQEDELYMAGDAKLIDSL
ncbi:MAG: diaminopimelate epimerase [Candidatus Dojkabacteria bacterium]|nr:MAG: diaminopimelate epimerase [Candidatus Dojkabacteria bacterium]